MEDAGSRGPVAGIHLAGSAGIGRAEAVAKAARDCGLLLFLN